MRGWQVVASMAALIGTVAATHGQVLIDFDDAQDNGIHDKEVRGGGFTGMTDHQYRPWVLLSKTGGMRVLTTLPCEVGSAENLVVCDIRVLAVDTGHTITAGDKFNLSFQWRDAVGWGNEDVVTLMLYYTDNDQIDGFAGGTIVLNTGRRKEAGKWEQVFSKGASFSNDKGAGKKLFARILTRSNPKEYARVDNVFVEVVPADPKPAADTPPATAPTTQPTHE